MAEETSQTIEIEEFVPLAKVDPIYFEGAYYLGPDKGGEKAYKLLAEAMRQTGRCALAKWAARGKRYLVLLRARRQRPRDAGPPLRGRGARRSTRCRSGTPRCATPR